MSISKTVLFALGVAAVTAFASVYAPTNARADFLTNGSFETGDLTGWTDGGNTGYAFVNTGAFGSFTGAQNGTFYVLAGPPDSDETLSQTFSDTAGQALNISFWLAAVGDIPSDLSISFNGTTLLSLTDPNTNGIWTNYAFAVTGTGSDTFTVGFRDDPLYIALDNFSITGTPLPATWMMLLPCVFGLGLLAHRRRQKNASLASA